MVSEPERVSRLTDGEARVLRAFLDHSDPKRIAQALGLSVNTVRDYLKGARRTLEVGRSIDAAHMLARVEGIYPQSEGPAIREVDRAPTDPSVVGSSDGGTGLIQLLPLPTKGRPWNDNPIWVRLIQIIIGLLCLLMATALAVSVGETVTRIVRQVH